MLHLKEGNWVFIRMDDGEDFYKTLYEILDIYKIDAGLIIGGAGMLRDFEIGWFNDKTGSYETEVINTPCELISLNGNISLKDGEVFAHIHTSLATPERNAIGGHLFSGVANNTVEMAVWKFDDIFLEREKREGFRPLIGRNKRGTDSF